MMVKAMLRTTAALFLVFAVSPGAAAMATRGPLTKALGKSGRKVVVHVWDKNPEELKEYAIDEVSKACRESGAAAILTSPGLIKTIAAEQAIQKGNFPGPLPIVSDCALNDLLGEDAATLSQGAKSLGASSLGIRYYGADWPEADKLEEALKNAIDAAEAAGLDTMLLPGFGADNDEGAADAAELASNPRERS